MNQSIVALRLQARGNLNRIYCKHVYTLVDEKEKLGETLNIISASFVSRNKRQQDED